MAARALVCAVAVFCVSDCARPILADESTLDIVVFQSGGRIAGKVSELPDQTPPSILIETADGQRLRFARNQVKQIIRASERIGEYRERAAGLADTIDAHLEMADWCKENLETNRFKNGPNQISPQRRHHLTQVLRFDPDHAQARMLLGFTKTPEGEWIRLEQVRLANGMVEYRNKWVTAEQSVILKAKEAWDDQQTYWRGKFRKLRNSNQSEWAAAEGEVRGITDPSAIPELVEAISKEGDLSWLLAYVDALGNIPPPAATGSLADLAVLHADQGVRERCLALLKLEGTDKAAVADRVAMYLRRPDNETINRAGFVLGELQQSNSILPLIGALVTQHKVANPSAGNAGQIGAGFSKNGGGGLSFGSNQPASLQVPVENPSVLEGLRRITGANFDFDETAWKDWYRDNHTLVNTDMRRDN